MTNNYTIDYTDKNPNRSFQLNAYTTNGPEDPTSVVPDSQAASANTSLLLYGRGSPEYGERLQEDILHTMEHFSGTIEPVYPIGGQVWYDRNTTEGILRVFNTRKHLITSYVVDTISAAPAVITSITVVDSDGSFADRFPPFATVNPVTNVNIINVSSLDEQLAFIVTGAAKDTPAVGITTLTISPVSPSNLVGWYMGGWEYLVQNNTGLQQNLPANNWKITGVLDPSDPQDVATKAYADSVGIVGGTLTSLSDVTAPTPSLNEFLVFDGISDWVNKSGTNAGVLELSGGTMTGELFMGTNRIKDLLDPVDPQDATTLTWVNAEIAAAILGAVPQPLDSLNDVTYVPPLVSDDVLQYNGAVWTNIDIATFASSLNVIQNSGGTMDPAAILTLGIDPVLPLEAATKGYVDTEIVTAVAAASDGVVINGFYNSGLSELTLLRSNSLPDVVIPFFFSATDSTNVVHLVTDARTLDNNLDVFWDQQLTGQLSYPVVPSDELFRMLNTSLGNLSMAPQRATVVAPPISPVGLPNAPSIYNIGSDNTAYSFGNLDFDFVPGYGNLSVYVGGTRQLADEQGWLAVNTDTGEVDMWPSYPTGLLPTPQLYSFQIQLNLGNPSDTGVIEITVAGINTQTLGQLIEQIMLIVDDNGTTTGNATTDNRNDFNALWVANPVAAFNVKMHRGKMVFYSSYPGVDSSVTLTDGPIAPGNLPLFANLIGGINTSGITYTYTIDPLALNLGVKNDGLITGSDQNPPAPVDRDYKEVGRSGRASSLFIWNAPSIPAAAAVVEIQIDNVPLLNTDRQPD